MIWIRSQDRRLLGCFSQFRIVQCDNKYIIHAFQGGIDAEGSIIAGYESKKQAIAILDSLENKVLSNTPHTVFEMPLNRSEGFTNEWET
mgnify:CR=1 FL=1